MKPKNYLITDNAFKKAAQHMKWHQAETKQKVQYILETGFQTPPHTHPLHGKCTFVFSTSSRAVLIYSIDKKVVLSIRHASGFVLAQSFHDETASFLSDMLQRHITQISDYAERHAVAKKDEWEAMEEAREIKEQLAAVTGTTEFEVNTERARLNIKLRDANRRVNDAQYRASQADQENKQLRYSLAAIIQMAKQAGLEMGSVLPYETETLVEEVAS